MLVRIFLVLLIFVSLFACHKPLALKDNQLENLIAWKNSRPEVKTFKGLAEGYIVEGQKSTPVRYVFLYKQPRNLRIDFLASGTSYTLQSIISKSGRGSLIIPSEKIVYTSSDTRTLIGRMFSKSLSEEELISALLANIDYNSDLYKWLFDAGKPKQLIMLEPFRQTEAFVIKYHRWTKAAPTYPDRVEMMSVKQGFSFVINFSKQIINDDVLDSKFDIQVPDNFQSKILNSAQ